jgi:hypothetical protein
MATEPFLRHRVAPFMILMLLGSASLSPSLVGSDLVGQCDAALARKAGGEVDSMTVTSTTRHRSDIIIRGRLTVFLGMATAAPGSASAHHLIRADYGFECSGRYGRP